MNRILLASDRVTDALLTQVHLIMHLGAILSFLCSQLAALTSVEIATTRVPAVDGAANGTPAGLRLF